MAPSIFGRANDRPVVNADRLRATRRARTAAEEWSRAQDMGQLDGP